MTTSVAYEWARAVMRFRKLFSKKIQQRDRLMEDGPTDRLTNMYATKKKLNDMKMKGK